MRDKISHYLQQHLNGEVMTSNDALDYFATDSSVFTLRPKVVVYPRNTNDIRKIARFSWQLAEKGHVVPMTARGKGTDQAGAAIGDGIVIVFPAHMNKILEINRDLVTVQPGIIYSKLEQALHTHYKFLPPYPSSSEYSTVGGAVANNASGEKSIKYGDTRAFTKGLSVVLSNGELIETRALTKRELNKKKGLTTMEGEIYRELDGLLSENEKIVEKMDNLKVNKNSAGYALNLVKNKKKNTFDLTPLFVGSQGTLGLVTQATMSTAPYNPNTTLAYGMFDNIKKSAEALTEILKLEPSAAEIIDDNLINFIDDNNPHQLPEMISRPFPKIVLIVEFDDTADSAQRKKTKKLKKIFDKYCFEYETTRDEFEKEQIWSLRHSAAAVLWHRKGNAKALPVIEDGVVPQEKFQEYIEKTYEILKKHNLDIAVWGHAGDANLHMQPFLDLSSVGDRQRVFKLADDYYKMVVELGGSTSGEHNDGRMRAPYLESVYGSEVYELFGKVKKIFDPLGTLNPGVKLDVDTKQLAKLLRRDYKLEHLYDHMPRT